MTKRISRRDFVNGCALSLAAGTAVSPLEAVAQDLLTAYLGNEDLDHKFRVLESLVLRIKRPAAICVLKK